MFCETSKSILTTLAQMNIETKISIAGPKMALFMKKMNFFLFAFQNLGKGGGL